MNFCAYGDHRYAVTQYSRTEILKLVFQYVEVRTMENSPSTNYGRESMTLFSSVPNGSRMNVIWAAAPLLFLIARSIRVLLFCVATVTVFAAPALLSAPGEKTDDQPSYNRAYRFLSEFHGVNPAG